MRGRGGGWQRWHGGRRGRVSIARALHCDFWVIAGQHADVACTSLPAPPADLKPLYLSSSKAALLGQLFEHLAASLQASGALPPLAGDSSSEEQPAPQALVW